MSGMHPKSPNFSAIGVTSVQPSLSQRMNSGRLLTRKTGGQYFKFTAEYPQLTDAEFRPIRAFAMEQDGGYDSFSIVPPNTAVPASDLTAGGAMCLNGQEVGAWMMDSLTSSVSDTELITDGDFATDISSWTDISTGTGSASWNASGHIDLVSGTPFSANRGRVSQSVTAVVGERYLFSVDEISSTGGRVFIDGMAGYESTSTGTNTYEVTATTTSLAVYLLSPVSDGATATLDNISVKPVVKDQTGNTPLTVNGTLTRTAVNTGCDLVAYSGFSASNYLSQAYDPAFDYVPATTGFFVAGWYKGTTNGEVILDRCDTGLTNQRYMIFVNASGYAAFLTDDNTTSDTVTGTTLVNDGERHYIEGTMTPAGLKSIYVDGELENTSTPATNNTLANGSAIISIGIHADLSTYVTQGSLALVRTGPFAPTATEVRRKYDIESQLFDAGEPLGIIPKVNGASQTGSSITADGYPASTLVHAAGDYISLGTDPKAYCVTRDCTSDSSGNATIYIKPDLVVSPQDDASITYYNMPFNVHFIGSEQVYDVKPPMLHTYQLDLEEVY